MHQTLRKNAYFPKDGIPIVVRKADCGKIALHAHEFSEIVLVIAGRGLHVTEQENWPIAAGDVFVVNASQIHGYADPRDLKVINVLFDWEKLSPPLRDLKSLPGYFALFTLEPGWRKRHQFKSRLRLSPNDLSRAHALVDSICAEIEGRSPGFQTMVKTSFLQLVVFLSRCYGRSLVPASRELFRIGEAISFLQNNFDQEIYLEELARIAHMSRRNFLRVFREALGASPMAYLNQIRVARAVELLRHGGRSVTQIGFDVGFLDGNYFCRQFCQIMGESPGRHARRFERQRCGSPTIRNGEI